MAWWVCQTEGNREHVAKRFLETAGYSIYLPVILERKRVRPLFPSYCFVAAAAAVGWYRARWSIAVVRIVAGSGGAPAVIADHIIDAITERERNGYVVLPEPPRLRPGDAIRVTGGLLMGATGLCAGMRGPERVAVLLGVLGTAVLPAGDVEAL